MNTTGTHAEGLVPFKSKNTITEKYIFGNIKDNAIVPAGNDAPVAIITDTTRAGDVVTAHVLGSNAGTLNVLAGSVIKMGDYIVSQDSKATSFESLPKGTYNLCGVAINNAAPGQLVEFTPILGFEKTKK